MILAVLAYLLIMFDFNNIMIEGTTQKIQSKLFEVVFQLPQIKEDIQNLQELSAKIQAVSIELSNQAKTNVEEIQRVCKSNSKLFAFARLLRQHDPPKGLKQKYKQNYFWGLISGIINMFTLMMSSPKMIQFFNKLNIPFSIYRIVVRAYCSYGKFEFLKKIQVEQSFKFIHKMLNIKSKTFPRLYATLVLNILNEYSQKYLQREKRGQNQQIIFSKQNERVVESVRTIINIALDLIKYNLKLAAESGVLVALYRKAIENDLSINSIMQMIESIAFHMNTQQNRDIVLGHLDLCRVFAVFTNVDFKFRQGKSDERIQKCAMMIEGLLSYCSTLFYFIYEKVTLKNFVISLKSKSKTERQLAIINEKIFKKLIDKALRYDRNKMQRSNNIFGLNSNYLNYRSLLILSFFLDSTELFQIYLNTDPNGSLFAGLGKISLMYFPITFQKGKYNKQIIQTIKLPSASDYERLNKDFLSIISYYDYCIIPYEYTKQQLISYLLFLKEDSIYNSEVKPENKQWIEELLIRAKQSTPQQFPELLLQFYIQAMQICEVLPWKPAYLKLSKFISVVVGYICNHDYLAIINACLSVVTKIFTAPKPNYFRYLYITALDDIGKYFQDDERVQELILAHFRNYQYSFRISRILLHADLNKAQGFGAHSHKKILQKICDEGCEELILQVIEIMRFYCIDYDDKADWGSQIICEKLIYHGSEEIACAAVEFCEEFVINHRTYKSYLYKITLKNIKDHNLRKRIMYLLLNSQKGIEILNSYNPSFIKDQIDLWLKEGHNQIKQFSMFLSKQSKKFTATSKQAVFLDIGKVSENRHKLIFLPWNVHINQKCFIALTAYKCNEQKIKIRVTPQLLVQTKIDIVFYDIGSFSTTKNTIAVKREEIIKSYERNRVKQNKEIKKFAIPKQNAILYFKYETGCLVLKKVIIDIPLSRDVYRSIIYPLSFLTLMTKTGKGFNYLREKRFTQQCIKFCKHKEDKQEKDIDVELSKGSLECLGLLLACWKLEVVEKIEIFTVVLETFEKTTNFQLKEVSLWVLNIIVKDEDLRRKLKQSKGWLILQSKYCGWLCYPQFYNQSQFSDKPINQFSHIMPPLLPERLNTQPFKLIQAVLQIVQKNQSDTEADNIKRNQMTEYFRKEENKEQTWDPKLLEKIVMYVSVVNIGIQNTYKILDLFTPYYLNEKYDSDFTTGFTLP